MAVYGIIAVSDNTVYMNMNMNRKKRKFKTDKFDTWKTAVLTHDSSFKRLVPSRLHELRESKLSFVSRFEFIRSKLLNFSFDVSGIAARLSVAPSWRSGSVSGPNGTDRMYRQTQPWRSEPQLSTCSHALRPEAQATDVKTEICKLWVSTTYRNSKLETNRLIAVKSKTAQHSLKLWRRWILLICHRLDLVTWPYELKWPRIKYFIQGVLFSC